MLAWWDALAPRQRRTANALTLCVVGYIAHYLVFTVSQPFYIEDAGISFAFARNWVEGHGFVTFPGGERVEGFSNPLWTFLVAFFYLFKLSPWVSSKLMGAAFGAITLPLVWAITRRARGGRDDIVNLVPPFLLAGSTQFVLWNCSGLENSLYCVLMAAATYRVIREGTDGGRPWSALLYFLLATTRPEGAMYGLVGLLALVVLSSHRAWERHDLPPAKRWLRGVILPTLAWIAIFAIPLVLYHWWRYSYFAWEYPSTYYAKLGQGNRFKPFSWEIRGWGYLRKYMKAYWIAWISPLFIIAAAGLRRWRGVFCLVLLAVFGLFVLWDGKGGPFDDWEFWTPIRRKWVVARCWSIYGGVVLLGLLTLGRRGWQALSTLWATWAAAMFYNIYVGGDWMDGFRWASIWIVPQCMLLGIGLGAIIDRAPALSWRASRCVPTLRTLLVAASALAIASPNGWGTYDFLVHPETSVRDVYRRVQYMTWVQERLDIDRVTVLDVDMGAHMWYSGWRIMDVAGLVDLRMGHHNYEKDFMREYVFQEGKPEFIHSHGGWSRKTKINNFPEFKRDYWEIPGYPAGRKAFHMGNHVARRFLTTTTGYDGPEVAEVPFEGKLTLSGWAIRSRIVPVEGKFHLETWFASAGRKDGFRMLVFLYDDQGRLSVQEAAPGYDFIEVKHWKRNELALGHYNIVVPDDFPQGEYKVGLVLLDEQSGAVLQPWPDQGTLPGPNDPGFDPDADPPAEPEQLRAAGFVYMQGEVLLDATLQVVSRKAALQAATEDHDLALHLAGQGDCDASWRAWKDATRHVQRNTRWHKQNVADINAAMALCHLASAEGVEDRFERAAIYQTAALYRYDQPELLAAARPLAAELAREGEDFRQQKDWESCYRHFDTAVRIDPRLSLARRRAEECRDWRLDLSGVDRYVPRKKGKKSSLKKSRKPRDKGKDEDEDEAKEPEADEEAPDGEAQPASPLPDREADGDAMPERVRRVDIDERRPGSLMLPRLGAFRDGPAAGPPDEQGEPAEQGEADEEEPPAVDQPAGD